MEGGPEPDDPTNLSVSVDWKKMRQERKMRVKQAKGVQAEAKAFKPFVKLRTQLLDKFKGNKVDKAPLMATLAGDDTVEQFPDTRSMAARGDESY